MSTPIEEKDTMDLNVDISTNLAWLLPVGVTLGACVVVAFDWYTLGWNHAARRETFKKTTNQEHEKELDKRIDQRLSRWVDGCSTMAAFWGGSVLRPRSNKDVCAKNYEVLAVLQALLFSISVDFYISGKGSDFLGAVACLGCCAFWMGTLSAAFLSVTVASVETDEQFALMVSLYSKELMAVPMLLFVWGSLMIFLQLVFFFKTHVDEQVSYICLGACLMIAPLFFHTLHKLSWVTEVIDAEADVEKEKATPLTPSEIHERLMEYVESKGNEIMDMDRHEFMESLKGRWIKSTSAQQVYARRLFDAHLDKAFETLSTPLYEGLLVGGKEGANDTYATDLDVSSQQGPHAAQREGMYNLKSQIGFM